MAPMNELDRFRKVWDMEAQLTTRLLEALPTSQYDFRPDPGDRSIGEMAWHLAEIEGYTSYGVSQRRGHVPGGPAEHAASPGGASSWRRGTAGCTRRRWRGSRT